MEKIKLFNRDGANLWLEKTSKEVSPNIWEWQLMTTNKYNYVLEYCRYIYEKDFDSTIKAIDPSGGPFLSLGDEFNDKYKIVKINNAKNIWISERNND